MKYVTTAFWLLASTAAALAQPAPAEVTLKFTQEKLSVLGQGLEALPYKVAAPLIIDIRRQIEAQQPAPAPK
jgi:hypothetical protein